MNIVLEQINTAGRVFVDFAWPMLLQSSVLIAILLFVDFLLRGKVRAVFRYWLWMLVVIKLVLPTSLSSPVSIGRFVSQPMAVINITENERPVAGDISNVPNQSLNTEGMAESRLGSPPTSPIHSQSVEPAASLAWQGGVLLVWLAVVVTMLLLLLQRAFFVCGLVRQSGEANDLMKDMLGFCCKTIGVRGQVGLKVSPNATSPAVCGLFRPVILLPYGLGSNLGSGQFRVVLMHELAHIKRGDLWVNLVQTLLQIVYFYNPLLWLANWAIRRVREQAVDEVVQVSLGEKAQQYPEMLLNVARLAFERPALSLRLIGVVESKSALAGRIKRMLTRPMPKTAKLGITGLLAVLLFAAVLLPMARASQKSVVDNAFRKQLPNGVTVELVGVCGYPSEGKQWWKPDGLPLGFNIETYDPSHYEDKNNGYEIAYKFEAPDGVYVGQPKVKGSTSQSGLEVKSPSGIQAVRSHINVWGNTTKVKFPVAAGEWEKSGQTSGRGQTTAMVGSKKIMFGPAEGTREKLVIAVTDDLDDYDSEYRLVALDNNGTIVLSEHNWFSNKDLRQHTFVFSGLDPAGVARFEFQTRPYDEWVEFKNVNVPHRSTGEWNWQTGTRTTPDFTIKGIVTDTQTGQPIAGAKVGDYGYDGNRRFGITDANGHYSYKTWSEEHAISVQVDGYQKQIKGFHTRLFPLDLFEKEKAIDFALEPGAKTDVRIEAIQPIDFRIASSGFLDGDSITITELAGSAGMIKPGHAYTVKGRYTLKSHDEAMLHIYATNGEVKSAQGPPVKRGEGEFSRTFTLLEDGDLHLGFYPAKGGNGFGGVYFAQKGAEIDAASKPVAGKIDVAVEDFDIQPYPEGGLYSVRASIRNKGGSTSPEFRLYFYKNDADRKKPMNHGAGPIKPGDVWNEGSMPFALNEGMNELAVVLDPDNSIGESDRTNNEASLKVIVKDGQIVEKKVSYSSVVEGDSQREKSDVQVEAAQPIISAAEFGDTNKDNEGKENRMNMPAQKGPPYAGGEKSFPDNLNEEQKLYMEWTQERFGLDTEKGEYTKLSESAKKELEGAWIEILKGPDRVAYYTAIDGLATIRSKKAIEPLLKVAAERIEKDNRYRWQAVRALGIIGDDSVVPELIHLVYHYNQNTRFWAQISLVRITGQNFGAGWQKWAEWWNGQQGKPRCRGDIVEWTSNPDWADIEKQKAMDEEFIGELKDIKTKEAGEAGPVPYTQVTYDEIRPDGTILFKNTIREINKSGKEITTKNFINSDFVQVTAMTDSDGRELKFKSIHDGDIFRYEVIFNEPIAPGGLIEYTSEGTMSGLVKPVAGSKDTFQYYMKHWPAAGRPTQRIETYLLPAGAELISTTPADMERKEKDGHIELHVEKTIPPGGSITTSFQYRMPETGVPDAPK